MTKILLVEDDKSLREIYGVRLLAEGYDIVSAGDGEEALAMAIKERPQLIISDVMMPKISGFDMLDILRSTTETKDIKVIMMTALSSEDQRERGESLGADRYLVKSQVGIEDVVRTVHEVLGDAPVATPGGNVFAQPTGPRTSVPVAPRTGAGQPAQPQTTPEAPVSGAQQPSQPSQAPQPTQPAQTTPAPQPPRPAGPQPSTPTPPQGQPAPSFSTQTAQASYLTGSISKNTTPPRETSLPQPTAPFSTDRPAGLGDRIIHPIDKNEGGNDINSLMAKELENADAAQPQAPQPSTPPTPQPPQPEQPSQAPRPPQPAQAAPAPQPQQPQQPASSVPQQSGAIAFPPPPPPPPPAPQAPKPDLKFEETPMQQNPPASEQQSS